MLHEKFIKLSKINSAISRSSERIIYHKRNFFQGGRWEFFQNLWKNPPPDRFPPAFLLAEVLHDVEHHVVGIVHILAKPAEAADEVNVVADDPPIDVLEAVDPVGVV